MPGLPWLLFKGAFKMTAKGAAVTLTSTVASCALACYIEIGAHRMVYHYFPHKYANVEHANGLTQEQLDAVRIYPEVLTSAEQEQERLSAFFSADDGQKNEWPVIEDTNAVYKAPTDEELAELRPLSSFATTAVFGKDRKREPVTNNPVPKPSIIFPSSDIMSCAMTG